MRSVPVGESVTCIDEVGAHGAQVLVGEVAQPPGDVRVGRLVEPVVEVGGGGEDICHHGEDAVVGGGQPGQCLRHLVRGGGLANALGEVGDGRAQGRVDRRAGVGVEVCVAADVVSPGSQTRDGARGKTFLVPVGQTGGDAVVGLMEARDGNESDSLQDAVRPGVTAAGEEFPGVRVTADL